MENFNWITYKKLNPDLPRVGLITKEEFESHWINYGKAEGRKYYIDLAKEYPNFNAENYKTLNPDLELAGITCKDKLEEHFIEYGRHEGRPYHIQPTKIIKSNNILVYQKTTIDNENKIKFHLLLPTVGRHSIFNMLDSIASQLRPSDYLTIVYDGLLNSSNVLDVKEYIKDWNCNIKIYIEVDNLGYWGHSIRNLYKDLEGDFILNIDDDDTLADNGLDIIRSHCINTNYSYIFCFKMNDKVYWEYPDIREGNIGTPCGVISIKANKLCSWALKYGGDYNYYLDVKKNSKITFIQKIIYIANHNNFRNISKVFYLNNIDDSIIEDCMNNYIDIDNILRVETSTDNILQTVIRLLNYSISNNYTNIIIITDNILFKYINIETSLETPNYIYLSSIADQQSLLEKKKVELIKLLTRD
jgi:hypothetical protein